MTHRSATQADTAQLVRPSFRQIIHELGAPVVTPSKGDNFTRQYRIAGWPYRPPHPSRISDERLYEHAAEAEGRLRAKLQAGEPFGPVLLVGPEKGAVAGIDKAGRLTEPAYSWRNHPDRVICNGALLRDAHGAEVSVKADIDAHMFTADPDARWAAEGSVVVIEGRIVRLIVAPWLKPIVATLEELYGVEVAVHAGKAKPRHRGRITLKGTAQ